MFAFTTFLLVATVLLCLPFTNAGFGSSSSHNLAAYWGQNSYGQGTGPFVQQRLAYYCANTELDILPLAFLITISTPQLNFANAGNNCTAISGSSLFYCPQLEADIAICQNTYNKTILLSIGGSTYTEGGFQSSSDAISAANNIWSIFGPKVSGSSAVRPFGLSAINGFDLDFESPVSNMVPFANQLRALMNAESAITGAQWYLTAAPQCPYPDAAMDAMLHGQVYFDIVFVQFYNNYCGLQSFVLGSSTQTNFNFATWDNFAKTVSLNPAVKVLLAIPGGITAAGSGYESGSTLAAIITYCEGFSSFGGVMIWDVSQAYANPGFLDAVANDLGIASNTTTTATSSITTTSTSTVATTTAVTASSSVGTSLSTMITTTKSTAAASATSASEGVDTLSTNVATATTATTPSSSRAAAVEFVKKGGQCGGKGWKGPTNCTFPYVCTFVTVEYFQCEREAPSQGKAPSQDKATSQDKALPQDKGCEVVWADGPENVPGSK